uniref:Apple domain-containing protein n=1 Tax=Romanomermis culicivorax TaxID=13658 RepID=A0A915K3J8_ROMCU
MASQHRLRGRCCPMPCRDAVHSDQQLINLDGRCFYHRKYVKNNCEYVGRDIQLHNGKILRLNRLNAYGCEYACLRYIQCTHFTWSLDGCFLKKAQTNNQISQSFKVSDGK